MQTSYKRIFRKFVKKQSRSFQLAIEDEVDKIIHNPFSSELKRADLAGLWVHKFKFQGQLYLMAYRVETSALIFYMIGSHENFYRDLKNFLKETGST